MSEMIDDRAQVELLQSYIVRNRFLPVPPAELMQCGDGDYRAVGSEFLGHFVHLASLKPAERVLDIGCGIGRMAVPLTQYLTEAGSYCGVDIERRSIEWCQRNIAPHYPNFNFQHLDLNHPIYNAIGLEATDTVRLPYDDGSFDVILLISVLTHLGTADVTNYAREISRLLAPGGRCFATAFLVNAPAREAQRGGGAPLPFDLSGSGPEFYAHPDVPLAAVAFDEDHLLEKFLRFGLVRRRMPIYGQWSGRPSNVFQDINIFE